jgi:type III pantothenate kinase
MLLVMDVGNSHTVLGLYDGDTLAAHWRIVTNAAQTADEMRIKLGMLFQQEGLSPKSVRGCCVSSVVPQLNYALQKACEGTFGSRPVLVGPGVRTGLVIQVENPKEVGADRIVCAVAAVEEYGGPVIVVDFGTATTFDAITAKGEYKGGVIFPGIQIAADALFERCAKLLRVDIVKPPSVIGKDTVTHIQSGLTYGYADMVDGVIGRIAAEMNASPQVIATGGMADLIAGIAKRIDHVDPFLLLKGLKRVYERNEGGAA